VTRASASWTPPPAVPDQSTFATGAWALRQIRAAAPVALLGLVGITLVQGLLPAAIALVLRELINETVALLGAGTRSTATLMPWLGVMLLMAVVEALSSLVAEYLNRRIADDLNLHVTDRILTHAWSLDFASFEDPARQDLLARTQNNIAFQMQTFVNEGLSAARSLLVAAGLLGVLALIEPLVLLIVPPLALPYLVFRWRLAKVRYAEEHHRAAKRRWTSYYIQKLTTADSVAELKILDLGPHLIGRFRELLREFRDRDRILHRRNLRGSSAAALLTTGALYGLFVRVAVRTVEGVVSLGDLAVFGGAAGRLRGALNQAIQSLSIGLERVLYVSNLREFLSIAPSATVGRGLTPPMNRGEIEIRDLTFAYPGSVEPILKGLSLTIAAGETLALVGENGAGKSTLVKLLVRLYDPAEGQIIIDGVDIRDIEATHLQRHVGLVLQTSGRYETTAAENIAYGDWRRLLEDREEIERLARSVGMHDMIEALGKGYDTHLGRRFGNVTLSGGEWQRIAVARAFAREASFLVLDEPTSNLDPRTEYSLFTKFKELSKGRTTLLVSHRFTTIGMADRIAVLAGGRIVESGTHDELLIERGAYSALYQLYEKLIPGSGPPAPGWK
jgi:ABC-type multidrug transport system fused ATPase/permease subunit